MKKLILFSVILFLLIPSITAINLQGRLLGTIIYEPGKIITNSYHVSGTDKDYEVLLDIGTPLKEYVSLNEIKNNEVVLTIAFPDYYIPVGTYDFALKAKEIDSPTAGISSLLTVSKRFKIEVFSYEKEILASLHAQNVDINEPVKITVSANSRTYSDINPVQAEIDVYDQNDKKIETLITDKKALPSLASVSLTGILNTIGLIPGDYWAEALINFDGKQKTIKNVFRIGSMNILLISYPSKIKKGFSNFNIVVKNDWSKVINNIYAKLYINGNQILQTPTLEKIDPWSSATLESIAKVDLSAGKYEGTLKLFFEGKEKEEMITIEVLDEEDGNKPELEQKYKEEQEKKQRSLVQILLVGIVVLIIIISIVMFIIKKRKEDDF